MGCVGGRLLSRLSGEPFGSTLSNSGYIFYVIFVEYGASAHSRCDPLFLFVFFVVDLSGASGDAIGNSRCAVHLLFFVGGASMRLLRCIIYISCPHVSCRCCNPLSASLAGVVTWDSFYDALTRTVPSFWLGGRGLESSFQQCLALLLLSFPSLPKIKIILI